jgi:GAF domain-containing protein
MSPQEGRGGLSGTGEASRQASRRLVAALSESGFSPSALQALIGSALSDPDRLKAVHDTGLFDRPNPELDRSAATAAHALGTPNAAVVLIDQDPHLMAGRYPGDTTMDRSMPLDSSLCKFAVATAQPFIVDDTARSPLVADNPLVRSGRVMSYAGIPIMDRNRNTVGALASWDDRPRRWTTGQIQVLTNLSAVVAAKIFGRSR